MEDGTTYGTLEAVLVREDPTDKSSQKLMTLEVNPVCRGRGKIGSDINTRWAVFGAHYVGLKPIETKASENHQPSMHSAWGFPHPQMITIHNQNLRQDAKDFMALARSNVAVDFQIVDLSLNRQMSVELPYLLSSFSTEWVRRGDQAWRQ